jgi:hypothetical protein
MAAAAPFRALVTVTTCRRLDRLRRYLPPLAAFVASDPRFQLLVALDGTEDAYLDFCDEWAVPLVYSDEREGVGISKNRVLERYPDFDYYFFLDDDVEVVDGAVFPAHVRLSRASGIHHFSLFESGGVRKPTGESHIEGLRVVHGMFGGAQFNFFTRKGLDQVGGWHPRFAEWRRWGHTEHSYRFYHAGLAPAPFNVAEDLADTCIWHSPPAVSAVDALPRNEDQLVEPERELIEERLEHVPVTTLSPYHVNGVPPGSPDRLAAALEGGRYPLVDDAERRRCWSDYHLWRSRVAPGWGARVTGLLRGALLWPGNPMLRHRVKQLLGMA